jgi:hypothetical protein
LKDAASSGGAAGKIVASWQFNLTVGVMIMLNTLQVIAEEVWRDPDKEIDKHAIWLILDGFFTFFFLFEFVVKFIAMSCSYFKSHWNKFDFFLVWIGVFGFVTSLVTRGEAGMGGKVRIIRVARVLRTLRFLRIFRLFHARMSADKFISLELARHMKKVTALDCYIRAHVMAQKDLVTYFGGNGKLDEIKETEIARCVLQSQVFTYKALLESVKTREIMGQKTFNELEHLHERKRITENLTQFIMTAHKDGALAATEAHAIMHPLNHLIGETVKILADRADGVVDRPSQRSLSGHDSSNGKKTGESRDEVHVMEEEMTPVEILRLPEGEPSQPDITTITSITSIDT